MTAPATVRTALEAPVSIALHRLRLRDGILCVMVALAAGFATLIGGTITARFGMSGPADPAVVAGLVALVVGTITALVLWLRRPPAARLAFRIDGRAGLGEAYGTAWNLAQKDTPPGPVGGVLMLRAARMVSDLDMARLEPVLTRATGAATACAVLLFGAWLVIGPGGEPARPRTLPVAETPAPETGNDALHEAARRMAEDAEALENDYLDAVSRALEDALEAIEAGETPAEDIETLLEHAARAYGDDLPDWLAAAPQDRLAGLDERLDAFAAEEAAREAAKAAAAQQGGGMYDRPADFDERYASRDQDELRASSAQGEAGDRDAAGSDRPSGGANSEPRRMDEDDLMFAGRIPVGAALNSGKGASEQAGLGTQEFEDDTGFMELEGATGETMIVSGEPQPGGNRIRIEVAPEVQEQMATSGVAGGLSYGGSGQAALPDRSDVPLEQRGLVVRYFGRDGS